MSTGLVEPIFTERSYRTENDQVGCEDHTESTDYVPTIYVGQLFDSSEEAFQVYKLYAKFNGFSVRIQRCYRRHGEEGEIIKKDFVCHRGNAPNRKKVSADDTRARRASISNRCNCKAGLRIAIVNMDGANKWHVIEFKESHNHELLTPNEVSHLRGHRLVSEHCKERILSLANSNVSVRQIMSIIAEEQKVLPQSLPFSAKDVHNYLGSIKRSHRTEDAYKLIIACLDLQKDDTDFKFEYDIDEEKRLRHIAWSHATSFRAYQSYGDVVLFDTTYKLNTYDMPVGIWVGVSNYGSSCFFGCCLLRDERTVSFEWAFKAFLRLMDGKAPISILTDQDLAIKDAIRTVFPATKHAICMWHIAKKFPSDMRGLLKENYSAWKESFWALYRVDNVEEFEVGWEALIDQYGLHTNEHMKDLYEERAKWASPYVRQHFFAGMTTTGRSESMNATLKRFVTKQVNLTDFIRQVTSAVGMMDYNGEMMMTKQKVNNNTLKTPHPLERHASEILTPYAFAKYQDEIVASFSYAAFIVDIAQGIWLVRKMGKSTGGRTVYHLNTESIHCSCNMYEFEGLLCRHAVAVMIRCNVFETPKPYMLFRWTRAASIHLPQVDTNVERGRYKLEQLQALASKLVNEGGRSDANHRWVMENLRKLHHQLETNTQCNVGPSQRRHTDTYCLPLEHQPLSVEGYSAIYPILTPPSSNPKGRKKTRRVRGVLEKRQKQRTCRVPGCGSVSHDRRNCPLLREASCAEESTEFNEEHNSDKEYHGDECYSDSDYAGTQVGEYSSVQL